MSKKMPTSMFWAVGWGRLKTNSLPLDLHSPDCVRDWKIFDRSSKAAERALIHIVRGRRMEHSVNT